MKQVYTAENRLIVYHFKNLLEMENIKCIVKNDHLFSVVGEVPMMVAWPELWVVDSDMEKWARQIIKKSQNDIDAGEKWTCESCGEEHLSSFTDCWNCQSIKAF